MPGPPPSYLHFWLSANSSPQAECEPKPKIVSSHVTNTWLRSSCPWRGQNSRWCGLRTSPSILQEQEGVETACLGPWIGVRDYLATQLSFCCGGHGPIYCGFVKRYFELGYELLDLFWWKSAVLLTGSVNQRSTRNDLQSKHRADLHVHLRTPGSPPGVK